MSQETVTISKNHFHAITEYLRGTELDCWRDYLRDTGNLGCHILDHVFSAEVEANGFTEVEGVRCNSQEELSALAEKVADQEY